MPDKIKLSIPAKTEMLLTARMALAGFYSQYGADIDTLDDIRMLSDEACYCLMHQPIAAHVLCIEASAEGNSAIIRFGATFHASDDEPFSLHVSEIARGILKTLASDIRLCTEDSTKNTIEVDVHLGPL